MFDRLSANTLLKSVILTMAGVVVVLLAMSAWSSWLQLRSASRIAVVADASAYVFTAMHNLRVDRASTYRDLLADKQFATPNVQIRETRAAEMPALKSAVAALENMDFPEKSSLLPRLVQTTKALDALHGESLAALQKPKAERRADLAKEFFDTVNALLDTLDKLSSRSTSSIKFEDAFIDQLMEIKQLAWMARNASGDASVMVSNRLGGQPFPPDPFVKFTANATRAETAWAALEDMVSGMTPPARLSEAIARANRDFFGSPYIDLRTNSLKALIAGEKLDTTAEQWAPMSVAKLAILLDVANAALDAAKEHAAAQHAAAVWDLSVQLTILVLALVLAVGSMMAVSRRVIRPLRQIQDAMLKVAGGDLSADASFPGRTDEIGALAGALGTFKQNAAEKARIEGEQQKRNEQRAARQQAIEEHIKGFEGQM
ncbi:MAG TPA: HAMP domain-containing protein, partial [Alphaproteobacteria bacterium]